MFAGQPPFSIATQQCPFYTHIINQQAELFWEQHEHRVGAGYYSQDFKDLVNKMLKNDPRERH